MKKLIHLTVPLLVLLAGLHQAAAQGTKFTYQGRVHDGGAPANGSYDLKFSLFNVSGGGAAVAGPLTNSPVAISNGLFTVNLDFGPGIFNGTIYWLQIAVRTNGGAFTDLSPRQELTPTPYAIYAANAPVAANSINSGHIIDGQVGGADIANGGVSRVDLNVDARYSLDAQDGAPTDVVFVNNSGLVGIGNPAPLYQLDVNGGASSTVLRVVSDNDPLIAFFEGVNYRAFLQSFSSNFYVGNRAAGKTIFRTTNLDRMAIDAGGNVGIGTTTPDADSRLHLLLPSSVSIPNFQIQSLLGDNGFGIEFTNPDQTWYVGPNIGNWPDDRFTIMSDSGNKGIIIATNGNVAIDSVSGPAPFTTLTVDGTIGFKSATTPAMYVYESGFANAEKPVIVHSPAFPAFGLFYADTSDQFIMKSSAADTTPSLVVDLNGNWVAIATDTPKPGYELSVNGQIVCEELLVEDSADWPDYVFKDNYPLRSLAEVERHIKERKHLPGVPTAADIEKDGLRVGDMQKRMMEKIEELTLYVIDQNKRLTAQEEHIRKLQAQLQGKGERR
jgi:hypothetical protein